MKTSRVLDYLSLAALAGLVSTAYHALKDGNREEQHPVAETSGEAPPEKEDRGVPYASDDSLDRQLDRLEKEILASGSGSSPGAHAQGGTGGVAGRGGKDTPHGRGGKH